MALSTFLTNIVLFYEVILPWLKDWVLIVTQQNSVTLNPLLLFHTDFA